MAGFRFLRIVLVAFILNGATLFVGASNAAAKPKKTEHPLERAITNDRELRKNPKKLKIRSHLERNIQYFKRAKAVCTGRDYERALQGEVDAYRLLAHWSGSAEDVFEAEAREQAWKKRNPPEKSAAPSVTFAKRGSTPATFVEGTTQLKWEQQSSFISMEIPGMRTEVPEIHELPPTSKRGKRIYFDFSNVQDAHLYAGNLPLDNSSNVSSHVSIRVGHPRPGILRLVIEHEKGTNVSCFLLEKNRLILSKNIQGNGRACHEQIASWQKGTQSPKTPMIADTENLTPQNVSATKVEAPVEVEAPKAEVADTISPVPEAKPFNITETRLIVVLDAGHGGKDTGALGKHGIREKDITLRVVNKLKSELEKSGDIIVRTTRDSDEFLELPERVARAERLHADLFISIHANAHRNKSIQGVETYFAASRKRASRFGVDRILSELGKNDQVAESKVFARTIHGALLRKLRAGYHDVKDLGVKRAGFWVLEETSMPSILVELGFVTHAVEGSRLVSAPYERELVSGLLRGILAHAAKMKREPELLATW